MRLKHGEHNESLCNIIQGLPNSEYNDWVVTTAFYACIHFVEHKLFPLTINNTTYKNFNSYYRSFFVNTNNSISKHEAKIELVEIYLTNVSSNYRWLFDACMNARYKDYIVSDMVANISAQTMVLIKKACI